MPFALTNKNIRIRYLVEKVRDPTFSLSKLGAMFMVTKQGAHEWTKPDLNGKIPTGPRAVKVRAWINDGAIESYLSQRSA